MTVICRVSVGYGAGLCAVWSASIGLDNYMTDPASLTRTPGPDVTPRSSRKATL
jgi:hypothetical protein